MAVCITSGEKCSEAQMFSGRDETHAVMKKRKKKKEKKTILNKKTGSKSREQDICFHSSMAENKILLV